MRYETQAAALHFLGALRQILEEVHWHLHFAELRHLLRLCWGQVVLLEDGVLRIKSGNDCDQPLHIWLPHLIHTGAESLLQMYDAIHEQYQISL